MSSSIDFSAQFGGRDAAAAVLPHFNALKAAARGLRFDGFPFAELAFILRVDGDVHQFGFSGANNFEIDKDSKYLSVDIGIDHNDRCRILEAITAAILSSVQQIESIEKTRSLDVDFRELRGCLNDLCARYKSELSGQLPD